MYKLELFISPTMAYIFAVSGDENKNKSVKKLISHTLIIEIFLKAI